jgi:hypothetical protein
VLTIEGRLIDALALQLHEALEALQVVSEPVDVYRIQGKIQAIITAQKTLQGLLEERNNAD